MRAIALLCLALAGCGGDIVKTETAVKVVEVAPPPKPALPAECKPGAITPPALVRKVPGDKTPVAELADAGAVNVKRMRDNYRTHRVCYCSIAPSFSDADKVEAEKACKKPAPKSDKVS